MACRLIGLDSLIDRLDLERIFGRKAPLHVDLGCGDGSFLCALAQGMPDKNFLGIERLLNRVRTSARKAAGLENVRLLRMESFYAVRYLLSAIHVATDDVDYFGIIKEVAESDRRFAISDGDVDLPMSRFGLIFRQKGASIHWLELRKISPVK